jgi:hypothetical protein
MAQRRRYLGMVTSRVSPDLQNGIISNPHDPTIRSTFRLASLRPTILVPASPRDDRWEMG